MNIRIWFVPFYDSVWKKNVSKEAVIGFNGRQVLDLQVKYAAYVFRKYLTRFSRLPFLQKVPS